MTQQFNYRHNRQPYNRRERLFDSIMHRIFHQTWVVELMRVTSLFYPASQKDWFDCESIELSLPCLHPAINGLRLAHLSDLHFGTWINSPRLAQAVTAVNSWSPDVIAITGDFITHLPNRYLPQLQDKLSLLLAPCGKFAVLGNHDHWTDPTLVREMLTQSGFTILTNTVHTIAFNSQKLHISGIDDYQEGLDRLDLILSNLPPDGCSILLAHEPDFADASSETGRFALQLSGHAHGGQIKLPWIGTPLLPLFGRKYPSGLYHINGMLLYTSRGLGTAEIQVRYKVRPEITFFTLKPAPDTG
jgi:hypothetical protein